MRVRAFFGDGHNRAAYLDVASRVLRIHYHVRQIWLGANGAILQAAGGRIDMHLAIQVVLRAKSAIHSDITLLPHRDA